MTKPWLFLMPAWPNLRFNKPSPVLARTLKPELPDWPGSRLFCSSRQGGVSVAPYDGLNLGDHVGDDPLSVAENRRLLAEVWGVTPVFMRQVHATEVVCIDRLQSHDAPQADACWSSVTGKACTIMVADCLPVLFYLPNARVVAAAHAGWRGLASGVLENTLKQLAHFGNLGEVKVWLGPCIGPTAFEVGEDVKIAFCSADARCEKAFKSLEKPGKYLADLAWLARHRLLEHGVADIQGNDSSLIWCTFTQKQTYFSHRRDGVSGRFAAGIALA